MEMEYPTITEIFGATARLHGADRAVSTIAPEGKEYVEATYQALDELSGAVSAGLHHQGIRPGENVAILSKPRPEWVAAFLGILKAGAVAVPIDPQLQKGEMHRLISACDAFGVIASGELYPLVRGLATQEFTVVLDRAEEDLGENSQALTWDALCAVPRPHPEAIPHGPPVKPEDVAVLLCTSGTMGDAKAVMLSHRNITSNVSGVFERLHVASDDVILSIAPWNHSFGLIVLVAVLWKGASMIYTNDYANLTDAMRRYGTTILVAVPKLYQAIHERVADTIEESRLRRGLNRFTPRLIGWRLKRKLTRGRLRFFVSGSAPLSPAITRGFRRLGVGLVEGYGLTEASPVITFSTPFNDKPGSVGPPLPNVETRLIDVDAEGIGELLVRGPNVMPGYYKNERRTREAIDQEGWLRTGDLAHIDADGWVHIKGRRKNVIVLASGKNVYPEEIEWELARIPFIEEILVRRGERMDREIIQALVYPNWAEMGDTRSPEGAKHLIWEEIRRRNRHLAPFKRIKSEQDVFILTEPLEKTTLNDIKRYLYQDTDTDEIAHASGNREQED